jgi:hypothetical protein
LETYLAKTEGFVTDDNPIFVTLCKPFHRARPNTLAKYLKLILQSAGLDTGKFTAHSFRSAASSKAQAANVSIEEILNRATWANEATFTKFYKKSIVKGKQFSDAILL